MISAGAVAVTSRGFESSIGSSSLLLQAQAEGLVRAAEELIFVFVSCVRVCRAIIGL